MKLVWLNTLVLVGTTLVVRATEEETHDLQDLQQGRQDPGALIGTVADSVTSVAADPLSSVLLTIGNVAQALNGAGGLGPLAGLGGVGAAAGTAAAGGAAALGTGLAAASSLKSAILNLVLKPLDLVNGILAIIALVLLIAYLVSSEGDIQGLVGGTGFNRREGDDFVGYYDTYNNYVNTARSLWNDPMVQRLTTAVQDAIIKYDE